MRLNLPRYHCVLFEVDSEFSVHIDMDAEIQSLMNRTHTHEPAPDDETDTRVALFGSRSRSGGATHQIQGRLTSTRRPEDLGIVFSISSRRVSDSLGPAPTAFRPVSALVEASSQLFGSLDVRCHSVFEYEHRLGYGSKILLPAPLVLQGEIGGITHIESAQFSRRENNEIEYQVVVVNSKDSESFVHSIDFETSTELNLNSIRDLVTRARTISSGLLDRPGGV